MKNLNTVLYFLSKPKELLLQNWMGGNRESGSWILKVLLIESRGLIYCEADLTQGCSTLIKIMAAADCVCFSPKFLCTRLQKRD